MIWFFYNILFTIGYSLMLRLIDAHTRTGNPLMYGWVFTLMLYQPFWGNFNQRYFKYGDGEQWYEYSMRRLNENPEIAAHVTRSTLARVMDFFRSTSESPK